MDIKLFPTKEEWGSGDEAMDNKLSIALKTCFKNLSFVNISEFYFNGLMLRPRTTNPAFHSTIELVTKALLHLLDTESLNDQMMLKIKGSYYEKNKINLAILEFDNLFEILRNEKNYRYKNQIDFYFRLQVNEERNPYVRELLKRSTVEVHAKIIMKDFRLWLLGEKEIMIKEDDFFQGLKSGNILVIKNYGEVWFHQDTIYTLINQDIL